LFTVELPIVPPESAAQPVATGLPAASERQQANILVVDDETAIVEILHHALGQDGHRVDTAPNGTIARRKIEKERYDLIVCDMRMPGISGPELYDRVRDRDVGLAARMLFSTGDAVSAQTRDFPARTGNRCLSKPFDLDAVRRMVATLLERPAA